MTDSFRSRAWSEAVAELVAVDGPHTDVAGRLARLAAWCREFVDVPAVVVLRAGPAGLLRTAAATGLPPEEALLLVRAQYEGPAAECHHTGRRVTAVGWGGRRSALAVPMRARGSPAGCVLLFADWELTGGEGDLVEALAGVAAAGVVQHLIFRGRETVIGQLQTALDSRVVIEQAKGMLAGSTGIALAEAFGKLRAASRDAHRRLADLAEEVVATGVLPEPGPDHRPRTEFRHQALIYRSHDEYLAGTLPFVREGLGRGEPVAVAVPGPKLRLLREELGTDGEAVEWVDLTRAGRNPGWIIPGVLRAFADQHRDRHTRIVGEPVWPSRAEAEYGACVQLEALINLAFRSRDLTILCPYDAAALPAHAVADAAVTHPVLVSAGQESPSTRYSPRRALTKYNRLSPVPAHAWAVAFDRATLGHACCRLAELADLAGLAPERNRDLDSVVVELAANSITHGGGSGVLSLWPDLTHVIAEVTDRGHLPDPLAGRRPAGKAGSGLLNVNRLADLVRTRTTPRGTTTRIYFAR